MRDFKGNNLDHAFLEQILLFVIGKCRVCIALKYVMFYTCFVPSMLDLFKFHNLLDIFYNLS